jgi:peptidoglycan/LPS O-acetylase OafA/YrhL
MHFKALDKVQSWGDPSYGLYIYAFPMQQVLVQLHPLQGWQLFCASLLVFLPIAYGSWHLLERRCIQLKKRA